MSGATKLLTAGGGGVSLTPASSIASDVTVNVPSQNCTLDIQGPAFSAYLGSNQTISSTVATKVQFNTKNFDTNSNYDNVTNYRFTPTVGGYYQVTVAVNCYPSTTPTRCIAYVLKNGVQVAQGIDCVPASTGGSSMATYLVQMNGTTDYLEGYALISAVTAVVASGSNYSYFQAVLSRTT